MSVQAPEGPLKELDPEARHADRLFNGTSSEADLKNNLRNAESNPQQPPTTSQQSLSGQERQPRSRFIYESTASKNDTSNVKNKAKTSGRGGMKKKLAVRLFLGIVSLVVSIVAFFAFLPLKMMSLMENLKEQAASLVERPVEKRMQYILTRYLAASIVAGTDDNRFDAYVCPSGGIICSTFQTWRIEKMEEKLGITIESNQNGSGGATKWKITTRDGLTISGEGGDFDSIVKQLDREINGSKEMRRFIKDELDRVTKRHQVWKRYAMRKMLMRKYDVKGWRGPEKIEKAFDTYTEKKAAYKIALKKRLIKATVGRVSPRIGDYLECLIESGDPNCKEKLQDKENSPPQQDEAEDPNKNEKDKKAEADAKAGQDQIANDGKLDDAFIDEALKGEGAGPAKELSKVFSKQITKKVLTGSAAGIGIIGALAGFVANIEGGAPNAIIESKNELAYASFATEFFTASDKLRAGDLDPENIQALGEILGNLEQSPFAQHEMGIDNKLGTAEKPVVRDCDGDGKPDAPLAIGQFICPNKKVTTNVTELIRNFPGWKTVLVPIATAWNSSAGAVVDAINAVAGSALDAIGFNDAIAWIASITGLGELAGDAMSNIFDATFGSPITGFEENGDAFDAISIGSKVAFNGMMKNGVDSEGKGMGMGGMALSAAQQAQLNTSIEADRVADFNNKPLLARLFDPYLMGSMANTLAIRTPSSLSAFISNPFAQIAGYFQPTTAKAFSADTTNAAGIAYYSYLDNDPAFNAPPETYTEESCKVFAEARDASYSMEPGETSPRYHKTDPCALEKVVCVAATANFTDDGCVQEFNLYQGAASGNNVTPSDNFTGAPGQTSPLGKGFSLQNNTDYSATPCAPGSKETQIYTHPGNKYKIRLCKVRGMEIASIISDKVVAMESDAARAGVDLNGGSFRSYEGQIDARKRNCSREPSVDPLSPSAKCSPPTALPGNSQHERGLAIDFATNGGGGSTIPKGSPQFIWLSANASRYGFYNLPSESWHWSTSGN